MLLQTQIDWSAIGRIWGPLGIMSVVLLLLVVAGARWFKSTMETTLTDARKERDAARVTTEQQAKESRALLESQANSFLQSLARRDDIMEKGFDEILHELRNTPRRK